MFWVNATVMRFGDVVDWKVSPWAHLSILRCCFITLSDSCYVNRYGHSCSNFCNLDVSCLKMILYSITYISHRTDSPLQFGSMQMWTRVRHLIKTQSLACIHKRAKGCLSHGIDELVGVFADWICSLSTISLSNNSMEKWPKWQWGKATFIISFYIYFLFVCLSAFLMS